MSLEHNDEIFGSILLVVGLPRTIKLHGNEELDFFCSSFLLEFFDHVSKMEGYEHGDLLPTVHAYRKWVVTRNKEEMNVERQSES